MKKSRFTEVLTQYNDAEEKHIENTTWEERNATPTYNVKSKTEHHSPVYTE